MKTRVMTAAVGLPILLAVIYFGGVWLALLAGLLAGIALWEYGNLLRHTGYRMPPIHSLEVIGALLCFGAMYLPYRAYAYIAVALFALLLAYGLYAKFSLSNIATVFFGFVYVVAGFSAMVFLWRGSDTFLYLLFAFLCAWVTDSGAYFVGRKFGQRKLAPQISPHKTVEGAIGGLLAALVLVGLYGVLALPERWYFVLPTVLVASVASQFGDLVESYIKRWADVKDSGYILPGHGGILDRFDSMLFIAPVVWLLLIY